MELVDGPVYTPDRGASRPLADVIGPLTDEQATRVLAIFNRRQRSQDAIEPAHPDAA